jgi:hypothetical protein
MKKVILTGGPCSGKSTVLEALRNEFGDKLILVPEVATVLLEGGFPLPGKDLEWSEKWQAAFQSAILPLQKSFEDSYALVAAAKGCSVIVCDRGMLDGAAYTPGGVQEFCRRYDVSEQEINDRYAAVINLTSLAVIDPEKYGKAGNAARFEPLTQAIALDQSTKAAWASHPNRHIIDGQQGIAGIVEAVCEAIRELL